MPKSIIWSSTAAIFAPERRVSAGLVVAGLVGSVWFTACGLDTVTQANEQEQPPPVASGGEPNVTAGSGGGDAGPVSAGGSDSTAGGASGGLVDVPSGGSSGMDATPSGGSGGSSSPPPRPPDSNRVDVLIDGGWKFNKSDATGADQPAFNDATWTTLSLPHSWNAIDGENGPTTTPAYYRGVGWYRKHYTFPVDTMANKKIYLQFDGSAYITDVWVNGTKVGSHAGGYATFRFDVTSVAKLGADNVIALRVDNSQSITNTNVVVAGASTANVSPRQGDFTFFGGCYRDVHVLATDNLAISPMDFGS